MAPPRRVSETIAEPATTASATVIAARAKVTRARSEPLISISPQRSP